MVYVLTKLKYLHCPRGRGKNDSQMARGREYLCANALGCPGGMVKGVTECTLPGFVLFSHIAIKLDCEQNEQCESVQ